MISSPRVITAPTGTSPASAATAARSRARRIGWGSGKDMAGRSLPRRGASVMPASRGSSVSVGGVALAFLGLANLYVRHLNLRLVAFYLNFGHSDIGFARADSNRTGLNLKRG